MATVDTDWHQSRVSLPPVVSEHFLMPTGAPPDPSPHPSQRVGTRSPSESSKPSWLSKAWHFLRGSADNTSAPLHRNPRLSFWTCSFDTNNRTSPDNIVDSINRVGRSRRMSHRGRRCRRRATCRRTEGETKTSPCWFSVRTEVSSAADESWSCSGGRSFISLISRQIIPRYIY